MRRLFGACEAIRKGPIDIGCCNGLIAGFGKLEKTKVRRNLIGARSLEGLGTLGSVRLNFINHLVGFILYQIFLYFSN